MDEKSLKLGENVSTAQHRLRKIILFDLIKKLNLDTCFRCGKKIEKIEELSIEHKVPWLNSVNPKELFYDLDNIAYSHCSCNYSAGVRSYCQIPEFRNLISVRNRGKSHNSKLNPKMVEEIRKKLSLGFGVCKIAREYGVAHQSIMRIRDGENWAHLPTSIDQR